MHPNNRKDDVYDAKVSFNGYADLLYKIQDLLKVSLHTLYNGGPENSGNIKNPGHHLISVLEIAIQLLPASEAEALDICHELFLQTAQERQ